MLSRATWGRMLDAWGRYRKALREEDTRRVEWLGTAFTGWIAFCLWKTPHYLQLATARTALLGAPSPWAGIEELWTLVGILLFLSSLGGILFQLLVNDDLVDYRKWHHLARSVYIFFTGYMVAQDFWWVVSFGGHVAVALTCLLSFLHLDLRDRRYRG
jgi:hypothetical protein